MYPIALFGTLLAFLSIVMVANPKYWSRGIVKFSKTAYFHPFEIASRLIFGIVFVAYAGQTLYPTLMLVIGYLLLAVGIGLSLTPPSKHRRFATWSAQRFESFFRPAGMLSFVFGVFMIYAALWGSPKQ